MDYDPKKLISESFKIHDITDVECRSIFFGWVLDSNNCFDMNEALKILNQMNIELHESFKKANGYSDLEIARKRAALDDVLIPESLSHHKKRLFLSGFKTCDIWFRYFNFASLIAIK